ncbi:galactose mutarotase-like enzyme [Pedobacter sp. UYP24]
MIILENDFIKASFSLKGAELQSLIYKQTNKNFLWSGDKTFWGKYSPVLFPIVGGLKDDTFIYEGLPYHLNRHGFARDNEFTLQQLSETELLFSLEQSSETLKSYPFQFHLGIHYKLEDNMLSCKYEVINPSQHKNLFFSLGGHPAFAVTTDNDISYADYYLEFNADDELIYHKIEQDLIGNNTKVIELDQKQLALRYDLFYQDAMVFKSLKSSLISLRNNKNTSRLDFRFEGFPYFGIWAAKNADFVCLEPWCGIADVVGHNQELASKEGILMLEPNKTFSRTWSISLS